MRLADVMDRVEVGMKMVVRSEYNPEYEVFGGKVVEKKGVYLCLEVDGILHGLSAKENSMPLAWMRIKASALALLATWARWMQLSGFLLLVRVIMTLQPLF